MSIARYKHICQRRLSLIHSRPLATSSAEPPRINQVGIQYLSKDLHNKIFPKTDPNDYLQPKYPDLIDLSKSHLAHNNLLGKKTQIFEPINIQNFPSLVGESTLDEHFYKIGVKSAQPYLQFAEDFLNPDVILPEKPSKWLFQQGWTKYEPGKPPVSVPYPEEDQLVFDVETLYKKTHYSCLATAVSKTAWYGWVSPYLINYSQDPTYNDHNHLIPFNVLNTPKLLIGFNVSYDRARVSDEYNIKQSKAFYLDAMALHIALSGICSQQRPTWVKHKKNEEELENHINEASDTSNSYYKEFDNENKLYNISNDLLDDPWLSKGSTNSLASVAEFHCNIKMNKDIRNTFSTDDTNDIIDDFNELMNYCANDVFATYEISRKLFPKFQEKVPHPVSFAALRHLGTLILPTTTKWDKYIDTAENLYQDNRNEVTDILMERAEELVEYITQDDLSKKPDIENDPWLQQLDWVLKEKRLKKNGEPVAKQAYLTGYPNWYRELFKSDTSSKTPSREMKISVRTRITPLLLKLKWEGYPLFWTDSNGWCFKIPSDEILINEMIEKNYYQAKLSDEDLDKHLAQLRDNGQYFELFKIPHPDGKGKRCTSVMSKSYLRYFENGILTSEYDYAKEILKLNSNASYWMGNRNRIMDQFVVFNDPKKNNFFATKKESKNHEEMGIILPKLCTMGTITRRATENTWLTASNSKKTRIGSELKAMVEAPEGYVFVGADVDSEELWIASLIGDSLFGLHGGTALGWMTLEGDKNEKTDLHSKTAEILGILRNDAKVFNYGRIYGAGVKFATSLLKQCNASLSDEEAEKIAKNLYVNTKGDSSSSKFLKRRMYHGGTESVMFNVLESIANQEDPRTPVLGASITDALKANNLNKNSYLTSRVNWTIQSSGVDYLHLLIIAMEYLTDLFKVDARLMITVHDELRYMTKEEDKYKVALLLQISNVWTRAMFCEQLGMNEIPQSCAFFSEVDIDKVLRKEVSLDCVTPSHPNAIPPGESLDITRLLEKVNDEFTNVRKRDSKLSTIKYVPRPPVLDDLETDKDPALVVAKAKLQNSVDKTQWRKNMNEYISIKKNSESGKTDEHFSKGLRPNELRAEMKLPEKKVAKRGRPRRSYDDDHYTRVDLTKSRESKTSIKPESESIMLMANVTDNEGLEGKESIKKKKTTSVKSVGKLKSVNSTSVKKSTTVKKTTSSLTAAKAISKGTASSLTLIKLTPKKSSISSASSKSTSQSSAIKPKLTGAPIANSGPSRKDATKPSTPSATSSLPKVRSSTPGIRATKPVGTLASAVTKTTRTGPTTSNKNSRVLQPISTRGTGMANAAKTVLNRSLNHSVNTTLKAFKLYAYGQYGRYGQYRPTNGASFRNAGVKKSESNTGLGLRSKSTTAYMPKRSLSYSPLLLVASNQPQNQVDTVLVESVMLDWRDRRNQSFSSHPYRLTRLERRHQSAVFSEIESTKIRRPY